MAATRTKAKPPEEPPTEAAEIIPEVSEEQETAAPQATNDTQTSWIFPSPPRFELSPEEFMRYWNSIPPDVRNASVIVYPYRVLPVCDNTQRLSSEDLNEIRRKHRKKPETNLGKMVEPFPVEGWAQAVAEWKGAGDYHFKLNNVHPSVKKTICMCTTCGETPLRDWNSYPPVLDIGDVVLEDKANQSYIRWAHLNGIHFPGESAQGDRNGDMAAVETVGQLSSALIEATKSKPADNGTTAFLADILKQAEARALEERRAFQELLKDSEARHEKQMEALKLELKAAKESTAQRGDDPLKLTNSVIEMAKAIIPPPAPAPPPPADNKLVDFLMQSLQAEKTARIEEMKLVDARHQREMDALAKRLEAMDARETARIQKLESMPAQPAAAAPSHASVFKEVIGAVEGLTKLKEKFGGDDVGGTGNPWVDLAAEALPRVLDTVDRVTMAVRPMTSAAPAATTTQQASTTLPVQQPQQETEQMMMANYARQIIPYIIQAIQNQMPGYVFAARMIAQEGNDVRYNMAVQSGETGVFALLQAAPEKWGEMRRICGADPIQKFVNEFLNVQAVQETLNAMQAQAQQAQAAPGPVAMPSPAATAAARPQATRPVVVESPAAESPASGGRQVFGPDGKPIRTVKTNGAAESTTA